MTAEALGMGTQHRGVQVWGYTREGRGWHWQPQGYEQLTAREAWTWDWGRTSHRGTSNSCLTYQVKNPPYRVNWAVT